MVFQELTIGEIEAVQGGSLAYDIGYYVGYVVGSTAKAYTAQIVANQAAGSYYIAD
jgi:hypothetical protein